MSFQYCYRPVLKAAILISYQKWKSCIGTPLTVTCRPLSLTGKPRSTVGCDIQQSLRENPLPTEVFNEYVPLPLGQLAAVTIHQKRQMSEGGRRPSQRAVHEEMLGGRDEPLGSSQNVADLHVMIVYNVGQVVGGEAICFNHNWIALHLRIRINRLKKCILVSSRSRVTACWRSQPTPFMVNSLPDRPGPPRGGSIRRSGPGKARRRLPVETWPHAELPEPASPGPGPLAGDGICCRSCRNRRTLSSVQKSCRRLWSILVVQEQIFGTV